ncbi:MULTISPECIES: hypothetical protein [Streptomyces]|uniref:hypothetical protein n=1 Tax=Streptomyces TaxID=1883 RepID=UPI0020593F1A|nr:MULTISPECIES: hypothetical protein [Streptomyces]UPT46447.1 hypothetical protein MWG59_36750 [Streptomyces sp. WAC00303]WIY80570.1 hypothetical protein QPM16_36395 [Streptomyces anulatus]
MGSGREERTVVEGGAPDEAPGEDGEVRTAGIDVRAVRTDVRTSVVGTGVGRVRPDAA